MLLKAFSHERLFVAACCDFVVGGYVMRRLFGRVSLLFAFCRWEIERNPGWKSWRGGPTVVYPGGRACCYGRTCRERMVSLGLRLDQRLSGRGRVIFALTTNFLANFVAGRFAH